MIRWHRFSPQSSLCWVSPPRSTRCMPRSLDTRTGRPTTLAHARLALGRAATTRSRPAFPSGWRRPRHGDASVRAQLPTRRQGQAPPHVVWLSCTHGAAWVGSVRSAHSRLAICGTTSITPKPGSTARTPTRPSVMARVGQAPRAPAGWASPRESMPPWWRWRRRGSSCTTSRAHRR